MKLRLRKTVSQSRCSHSRKGKSPRVYCLDPARQAHWLYQNDKPHVHLMGSPFCDVSLWGSKKCLIAVGWWRRSLPVCAFPCACCWGLAEVVCFPVPLAALIDDHSLFRANSLLLSGVHYSKRVSPGKRESQG